MARLPFDPSKSAAAKLAAAETAGGEAAATPARLSVSQLAAKIDAALKSGFPQKVTVVGELSDLTDRTHWYFRLKDADAVVDAVMFGFAARKVPFRPEHGMQVVATGRVEFYAKGGKVSFIVDKLEPVGIGALDLAFRKLCDELRALGWFSPERKRVLPIFPRRIAVITSRTGAALQDVLNTISRRCPAVGVVLADVRVQGDGAAAEVEAAIRTIGRVHERFGIDAILVTRGGGSKEDLWAFNERIVAEAIVSSPIPVVAAIGHETDTSIAELVADERCATPTQAAMRLTPEAPALLRQAETLRRRLAISLAQRLRHARQHLAGLAKRPALADPARLLSDAEHDLERSARRLTQTFGLLIARTRTRLVGASARLERAKPAAVRAAMAGKLDTLSARLDAAVRRDLARHNPGLLAERLGRAVRTVVRSHSDRLAATAKQLDLVGPAKVLERGYTITTAPDGKLIRSAADAQPGSGLVTRFADGRVTSTVGGTTPAPAPSAPPAPSGPTPSPLTLLLKPRKSKPGPPPDQLDLFRS